MPSTHVSVSLAPSLGPRRLCFKVRSRALYRATESVCAASTTITCKRRNRHNELLGCTLSLEHTYTLYKPRGPLHLRPRDPKLVTQRPIWLTSSLQLFCESQASAMQGPKESRENGTAAATRPCLRSTSSENSSRIGLVTVAPWSIVNNQSLRGQCCCLRAHARADRPMV